MASGAFGIEAFARDRLHTASLTVNKDSLHIIDGLIDESLVRILIPPKLHATPGQVSFGRRTPAPVPQATSQGHGGLPKPMTRLWPCITPNLSFLTFHAP